MKSSSQKKPDLFPDDVQIAIVRYFLTSEEAIEQFRGVVKPQWFESAYYGEIYEETRNFYRERKRIPSPYELQKLVMERFITKFKPEKIPVEIQILIGDALNQVQKKETENPEWLLQKTKEFASFHLKKEDVLDDVHTGTDTERLKKLQVTLQKISAIGRENSDDLEAIDLAQIQSQKIDWFWHNRIPAGKLSFIVGDPNVGKSVFTMMMAAHISKGTPWPDCPNEKVEKGRVLILTAEDALADTVRPRLMAHGGDCGRIKVITGTKEGGQLRTFNLEKDAGRLESILEKEKNVRLIIIDPVSAYVGKVDSYKDSGVRGMLAPFKDMAEKYNTTIIGVIHLNKKTDLSAIHRVSGSMAFVAAGRSVWLITEGQGTDERYFAPIKCNLSKAPDTLVFTIEDAEAEGDITAPVIRYRYISEKINANDMLRPASRHSIKDRAIEFLQTKLAEGEAFARDLIEEAKMDGISENALYRARCELGVITTKECDMTGKWKWQLKE